MADVGETKADASSFGLATGVSAYVLICKLYNEPDHATGNKIRSMMTTRIRNGNVWKTKEGAQTAEFWYAQFENDEKALAAANPATFAAYADAVRATHAGTWAYRVALSKIIADPEVYLHNLFD